MTLFTTHFTTHPIYHTTNLLHTQFTTLLIYYFSKLLDIQFTTHLLCGTTATSRWGKVLFQPKVNPKLGFSQAQLTAQGLLTVSVCVCVWERETLASGFSDCGFPHTFQPHWYWCANLYLCTVRPSNKTQHLPDILHFHFTTHLVHHTPKLKRALVPEAAQTYSTKYDTSNLLHTWSCCLLLTDTRNTQVTQHSVLQT